jgi:exonuclease VII small subunit
MTQLSDQLAEIGRELDVLLAGDDNRRIIEEVESATEKLRPAQLLLSSALAHRRALCGPPVDYSAPQFADTEDPLYCHLQESYEALKEKWQENPASVRQRGAVGKFCESVKSYAELVEEHSTSSWEAWRDSLERQFGIATAQLESVKNVLDYAGPITKYKQGMELFAGLSRRLPEDRHVLQKIKAAADELKNIKDGLVFDLPKKVVNFFNALDRDGQFPLSRLDSEIGDWLAENDGLKDLAVVRRRMSR